jgi:Mg-chelatase subunit ChlD
MRFSAPWVLALLPVAVIYLSRAHRRSFVNLSAARKRLAFALRMALVTGLTLTIARPSLTQPSHTPASVLLVDVSASITEQRLNQERAFVAAAWASRGQLPLHVATFAGHARRAPIDEKGPRIERHDEDATDLGQAIDFARSLVPDQVPRIALVSDGQDNAGGTRAALERAVADGVEIDRVILPGAPPVDARVVGLHTAEVVRRQEPTRLTVAVDSTRPGTALLRIRENDFLTGERSVTLQGGPQAIEVDLTPTVAGLVRYGAEIALPGDEVPRNDRFTTLTVVSGPPRVLLVSSTAEEGVHLEEALAAQEISVEMASIGSLPSTLDGLLPYDEVILAGVSIPEIDRLRQSALASYVRDTGGGLLFVAGRQGLRRDPSGRENALEALLPVELATPSERAQPPAALLLLIDRSGSMTGEKLDYAKKAALAAIDRLSPRDQVGVIAFDAHYDWILPMTPVDDKEKLKAAVASLGAGGGTKFYPALEEAYFTLGATEATVRHVILLTDGVSTDPNIFPELLAKMRAATQTVSTVAIGHGADVKLLREIAQGGGGRFTLTESASQVPNIFVKETEEIQRDAAQRTDTLTRIATPARELSGIDFATAPPLSGYTRTRAKAATETLLETPSRSPLLVRWRYGLGQVFAFTSDATAAWGVRWLTWSGFGKLWAQLARGAQRPRARHDLSLAIRPHGDRVELTVEAVDASGRLLDDLAVRVRLIDGLEQPHEPVLRQVGPGRYATELAVPPGSVLARPFASRGGRVLDGGWVSLSRPYPAELAALGDDEARLARVVEASHGRQITDAAAVGSPTVRPLPHRIPLAGPLGLLSVLLFLADLMAKRVRWEGSR